MISKSDIDKLARAVYEGINDLFPSAQEWVKIANLNAVMNMVTGNGAIDDYEGAMALAVERLRELCESVGQSRKIKEGICVSAHEKLYDLCAEQGWGALTVEVKAGVPVMVREYRRDIKLTV